MESNKANRLTFPQKLELRERMESFVSDGIIMIVNGGCYLKPGWTMIRLAETINSEEPGLGFPVTVSNVVSMRDDIYGPLVVTSKSTLESRVMRLEQEVSDLCEILNGAA